MFDFIKKNMWLLLGSFVLPAGLLAVAFAFLGIYWGSDTSILAGDAYHQYVAIHTLYRDILHNSNLGFLYAFTNGLGLNLYAFSAYYMGSFFMPITYFFNVHNMPDALYLITLLKFGTIGLSSFVALKNMYKKLPSLLILALSTSFTLMSFLTSQVEIIMWLDVFIWLPLIIWGMHALQDFGKRRLYFITLSLLFIQNYYFGFMVALFLIFYFLARSTFQKWSWRKFFDFALTSALSAFTSLVMLLPMYLDLKANNSQAVSQIDALWTQNSDLFDLFSKNFIGAYDTTQYNAVPMIYLGLLPLLLALTFFFLPQVKRRTKLAFGALLTLLIASFYLQFLDLAWQGMHSPNMFLHRYAFLFSLIILLLTCETLTRYRQVKLWMLLLPFVFLSLAFISTALLGGYPYIYALHVLLTLLFMLAYFLAALTFFKKWLPWRPLLIILSLFMAAEAGLNTYYQLSGIKREWNFASRNYYNTQTEFIHPLIANVHSRAGNTFVRTENIAPDTANDGMKYNYNALSQFSSVRNSNSSKIMKLLGFHADGTYLNLRYPENTLIMDSLLSINYNINQFQPEKYGFKQMKPYLFENKNALSLGIFVQEGFKDAPLIDNKKEFLKNQESFLNHLTHRREKYFTQFYAHSETSNSNISGNENQVTLTRKLGEEGGVSVSYDLTAPAHSQIYLELPNVSYLSQNSKTTTISISAGPKILHVYNVNSKDVGNFYNLGYFAKTTPLKVSVSFPENTQVSFGTTRFWALDTNKYQAAIDSLKKTEVKTTQVKNGIHLTYKADSSGQLFLTLPYDKGWTAKLDGKPVKLDRAQQGFMKLDAPAGQHKVELQFFPQGLKAGLTCFFVGIFLFIGYDFVKRKSSMRDQEH
ncbi:YfhO family protein [Lactococcus ileimucosae]|uniref:YfhO family protein n=1 Tax=Lactococcus ileimucosae TaxID=2941329 RepID=UPI002044C9B6|nr:YfhO family protein [Lactococcus ileimucosae]